MFRDARAEGTAGTAEERYLARDLDLAAKTGGWLYALHVSTGAGIDLIRQAKASGVHVTAEAMPHHLLMTDKWVAGDRSFVNVDEPSGPPGLAADPNTKVNPPLRPRAELSSFWKRSKTERSISSLPITPRTPKATRCPAHSKPHRLG